MGRREYIATWIIYSFKLTQYMESHHYVKFFGHSHCTQQAKYSNTDKSILSSKLRACLLTCLCPAWPAGLVVASLGPADMVQALLFAPLNQMSQAKQGLCLFPCTTCYAHLASKKW